MNKKIEVIKKATQFLLENNKKDALDIINSEYKFEYKKIQKRSYTEKKKLEIFMRDGFIDRYSGDKLLNPGILKVLSAYFPVEFPYQKNWKMSETHIAYWELLPTIDHINPIALGGEDNEHNYVTTSQLHNSIKSNYTLDQIGWKIYESGDIKEWDGLTQVFINLIDSNKALLNDKYIERWYYLSKSFYSNYSL